MEFDFIFRAYYDMKFIIKDICLDFKFGDVVEGNERLIKAVKEIIVCIPQVNFNTLLSE